MRLSTGPAYPILVHSRCTSSNHVVSASCISRPRSPASPFPVHLCCRPQVVGVDNTVARYHPAKPLVAHVTPFAERVTREMEAEQAVVALRERMAAAGGAAR